MIDKAIKIIQQAKRVTAFTGAGISVESGIPPFRGDNGLWNKYHPIFLDIRYFKSHPLESWKLIKEIFYDFFGKAKPNQAHFGLAEMEERGYLSAIITQNIDNLHQKAGSQRVYEFHGNSRDLVCTNCSNKEPVKEYHLENLPPKCPKCPGILRPDFVFFGEPIPELARSKSYRETRISDVFILIGTTGEIMPASQIPIIAKINGVTIIEINIKNSNYTNTITDVFLQGKATKVVDQLVKSLLK
ncbi:MAG: NAD-dependent protein deacylase [Candidatus Heimdallarchaeota archaeon]|nr:NAD-dependent protein deacylase [Candidatus Heimdallarchaeota archaeon]